MSVKAGPKRLNFYGQTAIFAHFVRNRHFSSKLITDKASIFIDVSVNGRAFAKCSDCHCREYKILKAHWRLFHKDSADLEAARSVYLRGVNEYMTQQNALDLIVKNHPQFEKVYDAYQDVFNALKKKKQGEAH